MFNKEAMLKFMIGGIKALGLDPMDADSLKVIRRMGFITNVAYRNARLIFVNYPEYWESFAKSLDKTEEKEEKEVKRRGRPKKEG